jgi:hypothetical protein
VRTHKKLRAQPKGTLCLNDFAALSVCKVHLRFQEPTAQSVPTHTHTYHTEIHMFCVTERWVSFATTLLRCNRRKLNTRVHNERDVIIVLQSPRDQHVDYSGWIDYSAIKPPGCQGKGRRQTSAAARLFWQLCK